MNDDTARKVMGGAAVAALLGTFLTWASVFIASVSGIETDNGKASAAAAAIGGALLLARKQWWWQALAPIAAGGFAVWYWHDVATPNGLDVNVQVGAGVYLTIGASIVWWLVAMNTRHTVAAARRARAEA